MHADIFDVSAELLLERFGRFDIVLASPPCEAFSVLQIGRNWTPPPTHQPKTDAARIALLLVEHTVELITALAPDFFVIENPRAKLRKLAPVQHLERRTVTYCQYGHATQKPTDLWGGFPPSLALAPACAQGAPCHVSAPRGSRTGIQGPGTAAERALVPTALSRDVCKAAEWDLSFSRTWRDSASDVLFR